MQNLLTINQDVLQKLMLDAQDFVFDPASEAALKELVTVQKQLDEVLNNVKAILKKEALDRDPTTRSIEGSELRVTFSPAGTRFKAADLTLVPADVLDIKLSPKKIDAFIEKNDKLPEGVIEVEDRSVAVRISFKEATEDKE